MSADPKPAVPMLLDETTEFPFATKPAGPWPAVTGAVRPALPRDAGRYYAALAKAAPDPAAAVDVQSAFIARHVKAWSVVGAAGEPVPVTAEVVARLPEPVFTQLEAVALGYAG